MANAAQCYYCFECLSASFEGGEAVDLAVVEELWARHEQAKKLSTLQNADGLEPVDDDDSADEDVQTDGDGLKQESTISGLESQPGTIKLPRMSRLQSEVSISHSSSASTTPSVQSSSSSHSFVSSTTAITTPSAQSDTPIFQGQMERRYPLFVTWNTISKNDHKSLRGCIGTFEAQELSAGLKSYALTSAFDDTRFSPIPAHILPSLSCSLTLLGSFEPCTDAMDWVLGVHGLRISFIHRGRRYGATYLPDVPLEQGWSKEETVESLMRKAGWEGATSGVARRFFRTSSSSSGNHGSNPGKPWDQVSDFRSVKYQGLKANASYAEWQEWRSWVLSLNDGSEKLLMSAS